MRTRGFSMLFLMDRTCAMEEAAMTCVWVLLAGAGWEWCAVVGCGAKSCRGTGADASEPVGQMCLPNVLDARGQQLVRHTDLAEAMRRERERVG